MKKSMPTGPMGVDPSQGPIFQIPSAKVACITLLSGHYYYPWKAPRPDLLRAGEGELLATPPCRQVRITPGRAGPAKCR